MLFFAVSAQSQKGKREDIFKDLAKTKPGYGTVKLQQNPKVNLLVNRKIKEGDSKKYITFSDAPACFFSLLSVLIIKEFSLIIVRKLFFRVCTLILIL